MQKTLNNILPELGAMNKKLLFIFILAFILRLSLVFTAHHGDLNNNITWATIAAEGGLNGFYEGRGLSSVALAKDGWPYSAPNQPPLTILAFALVRVVWQTVENTAWWLNNSISIFPSPFIWFWEARGMVLLIKLPGILADLGIGLIIYRYFKQKNRLKVGLKLAALWLFNPITWYNSAIWGQTDSVVNLLGLAAVILLLDRRLVAFSIAFTLSLLFKGSLIIFTPFLFAIAVLHQYNKETWIKSAIASGAAVLLSSILFHPYLDLPLWLISLYKNRILPGEIGYLTANAFNFWWLVDAGKTLDSKVFLGLSARLWGFAIAAGGIIAIVLKIMKKLNDKRVFLSLMLMSLLTFLFMTRVHERYLYPFFPYATMMLGLVPGLAIPYLVLSITHLLNLYHLFWAPPFSAFEKLYQVPLFVQAMSMVNIIVFFYLLRLFRKTKI